MDSNNHAIKSTFSRLYSTIFRPAKDYPIIDKIIVFYVGIVLFFQVLLQISPIITLLTYTPLYSIQTYLGLLGGVLIVLDLFTTKRIWQCKYCLLLYAILLLAAISSVKTLSYGIKDNAFKLCWAGIQFVLMYSCAYRVSREELLRYVKILFYILLAIWFVSCCISLYQYLAQISYRYVVNPLSQDSSSNRQGFYDDRLFGIFYTLNHAAYISLLFLIIAVVFTLKEKRTWLKVCFIIAEFVLLCYIILSGSRSATISLAVCCALIVFFLVYNKLKTVGMLKSVICILVAVAAAVVCMLCYHGLKAGMARMPSLIEMWFHTSPDDDDYNNIDKDLLSRENDNLDEDASNGRISIWRDYISIYDEVGAVGLSPGNYMPYIMENDPELYIVEYIKNNYPDKYDSGIIYHVHNGYLMVYVSAGIAGALCLAAFIILCIRNTFIIIKNNKKLSYIFIGALAVVAAGAISALFDEGLFFQNNPHTTMFWLALSILARNDFAENTSPMPIITL